MSEKGKARQRWVSVEEAARVMGLSEGGAFRLILQRAIRARRVKRVGCPGRWLVDVDSAIAHASIAARSAAEQARGAGLRV